MKPEKQTEQEKNKPDMLSQETVLFWARAGQRQRLREKAEYEATHYDRLAIYGNILDD